MNNKEVKNVEIKKFINSKDKKMEFNNFQDLLKEGSVFNFYFIYIDNKDKNQYRSKNIIKLDLYKKLITTVNGNVYKFCNEI